MEWYFQVVILNGMTISTMARCRSLVTLPWFRQVRFVIIYNHRGVVVVSISISVVAAVVVIIMTGRIVLAVKDLPQSQSLFPGWNSRPGRGGIGILVRRY